MIEGLVSGELYGRPEQRTGRSRKALTVGQLRTAAGDGESVFINVVAFIESAQTALLALAIAGTLMLKAWVGRGGVARPSLDLVTSQMLTAYCLQRKRAQEPGSFGPEDGAWLQGGQT